MNDGRKKALKLTMEGARALENGEQCGGGKNPIGSPWK